jgi:hypothetical protein
VNDWKFGTVLHRSQEGDTYAMVIGQNRTEGVVETTDTHFGGVGPNLWIGLTLAIGGGGPWGFPGDTTWLLDDDWVVVE